MPNWCEGTLKIRGKSKDLKKFILGALKPVDVLGNDKKPLEFDGSECSTNSTCWIEGTRRGFVDDLYVYLDEPDSEEIETLALDARFAWAISADDLHRVCLKYNVDMKIYGFEKGMEFNQDIEIVNGEIVKDKEITFEGKDYTWECILPNMGG